MDYSTLFTASTALRNTVRWKNLPP